MSENVFRKAARELIANGALQDHWELQGKIRRGEVPCPRGLHRGPEGPNEDLSQCHLCFGISYRMRPWGETFGLHADDCSLPIWHESYCKGGGSGHPPAPVIRG